MKHTDEVEAIFDRLVEQLKKMLPDFGKHLTMDSKAISSFAKQKNTDQTPDGSRDTNADYGKKSTVAFTRMAVRGKRS